MLHSFPFLLHFLIQIIKSRLKNLSIGGGCSVLYLIADKIKSYRLCFQNYIKINLFSNQISIRYDGIHAIDAASIQALKKLNLNKCLL